MKLAEIDEYDPSEEQFASSLAGRDSVEEQELSSGSMASARQRYARMLPDIEVETPQPDLHLTTAVAEPEESWRDQVSSRIQNYKARRRRAMGSESLSFNFESTAGNHVFLRPEREPEPEPEPYEQPDPLTAYYAHPYATAPAVQPEYPTPSEAMDYSIPETTEHVPEPSPIPESPLPPPAPETAKLILFPKPPMMQTPPNDQLAEPVFNVPRIVDVPDACEAVTVPLADITLQPDSSDDTCVPYIEPVLDLPVPVAPVAQRIFAEVADTLLVLVAGGIFGAIAFHFGAASIFTDERSLTGLVVLVPAIFWAVYKYMFLVHGGATLGMKVAKLRLVDFDGTSPTSMPRRYRALAMLISAFPLGLGLLWSFVDTETLCWHDRISKTYVTAQQ